MGYTGPNRYDAGIEDVREISTHPSPSKLQEKFRVPCVCRRTSWGVRRLAGAMDLTPGPIVEAFSRAIEQSKVLLTSLLKLPPVKALKFSVAVELGIGRTVIPSQNNNGLTALPNVYTLRDENIFRLNLQVRHTKAVKDDDSEIETAICNNAAVEVFQGGYRAKRHEILLHPLRNIMAKCSKCNVTRSFVSSMVEAYGP